MRIPYRVTADQESIVIELPRASIDDELVADLLERLDLELIRRRSGLSEAGAAELAADVKRGAWERVKHLFEGS